MKKTLSILTISGLIGSLAFIGSCQKEYYVPPTSPSVVSYEKDIQPIFDASCTNSGCHIPGGIFSKLDLSPGVSYNMLLNGTGSSGLDYVVAKDPDISDLYAKVNTGGSMNSFLNAGDIGLIKQWIEEGAKSDASESTTELLVAKFTAPPTLDGNIDGIWAEAQKLVGVAEVPNLGPRMTYLNSDGKGFEEGLGLFEPYNGDKFNFSLRSGYYNDDIYFLMEWDDPDDSRDRQSWFFDPADTTWKQQHKYANDLNDKYYEDKFAFLFPIGNVTGFDASTCYSTCHTVSSITTDKDKHTRHYLKTSGELVDMWHWKRVRGTYLDQVDDQQMKYVAPPYDSGSNGRGGDDTGDAGYSDNKKTLTITGTTKDVSVPKYIIPGNTDYHWISIDEINDNTAKEVTDIDINGVLTLDDGSKIDPANGGFEETTGNKRVPSVTTKAFTLSRADIDIKAVHTGTGWICEFTRKLDTGNPDDVVFDVTKEFYFGLALFEKAAIAHAIKPNLLMKFE